MNKNLLFLLLFILSLFFTTTSQAQKASSETKIVPAKTEGPKVVASQATPADTSKPKRKGPDYSYLSTFATSHTNVFGTVTVAGNPSHTQMYPKAALFGDSSSYINNGAKFELLSTSLTPAKHMERILIKVVSNPPSNEFAGDTGWIMIQHTDLYRYYDREKNSVDTNFLYNKYKKAAAGARAEADKTKCSANKKCYQSWAGYYDCMSEGSRFGRESKCALVNCAIEDCPADK